MAASQSFFAIVAELADAHGSGPCTRKGVGVRVPSMAPRFLVDLGPLQMRRFRRIMPYFSCQSIFERANLVRPNAHDGFSNPL